MANRLLAVGARTIKVRTIPLGAAGAHSAPADPYMAAIGTREIVGFGMNGQPIYVDRADFPMPSIRWGEPSGAIKALREKEKGDWSKLSLEEKKALYRATFRQTFSEFKAPTGEWKQIVGVTAAIVGVAIWMFMGMKFFVYNPLPESFSEEAQRAQLRRILDLRMNPIQGIASKWDYEKDDWKK